MAMIRLPEVMKETGLSRSSVYRLIKSGEFPQPVNLGPRAVAWIDNEVREWIDSRIQDARNSGETA
ncbi:AlpA family transcriptional regulator [Salinicola lusitanus]|uniref:AlpA family transcriptional regulator n=1 Tax=Salinicola lusitanus TaxID=1949085 RepID=A0ABZ3CXP2_9GAMM